MPRIQPEPRVATLSSKFSCAILCNMPSASLFARIPFGFLKPALSQAAPEFVFASYIQPSCLFSLCCSGNLHDSWIRGKPVPRPAVSSNTHPLERDESSGAQPRWRPQESVTRLHGRVPQLRATRLPWDRRRSASRRRAGVQVVDSLQLNGQLASPGSARWAVSERTLGADHSQ